jgi:AraC family transcriptional regulator
MDWQTRMTKALEYLERTLTDEIDMERTAREANCSLFYFMRMFEVITGSSAAEYVRRRRLSKAALELASGQERVLDIALKFGYDSPDSFARAFRREFGCLPSEARLPGTKLHTYPPLSFSVVLKGATAMEYRIEQEREFRVTGLSLRANSQDGSNLTEIPGFWDTLMADGRCDALCAKGAGSRLGVCGVCHSFDMNTGRFVYAVAIETPESVQGLPRDCEQFLVPASTWAKFTCRGPLHPNLHETIQRIFSEWFPSSGREHAGTAEIEFYPPGLDTNSPDYWCEYWVPLK